MKTVNQFSVSGIICKDAEVKNFEKSNLAQFGIIIKSYKKVGKKTETTTAILNSEMWIKKEDTKTIELLKKGKVVVIEGFFKVEQYTNKEEKQVTIIKNVTTKISEVVTEKKIVQEKKEKTPAKK